LHQAKKLNNFRTNLAGHTYRSVDVIIWLDLAFVDHVVLVIELLPVVHDLHLLLLLLLIHILHSLLLVHLVVESPLIAAHLLLLGHSLLLFL